MSLCVTQRFNVSLSPRDGALTFVPSCIEFVFVAVRLQFLVETDWCISGEDFAGTYVRRSGLGHSRRCRDTGNCHGQRTSPLHSPSVHGTFRRSARDEYSEEEMRKFIVVSGMTEYGWLYELIMYCWMHLWLTSKSLALGKDCWVVIIADWCVICLTINFKKVFAACLLLDCRNFVVNTCYVSPYCDVYHAVCRMLRFDWSWILFIILTVLTLHC